MPDTISARFLCAAALALALLAGAAPARAELRIGNIDLFLNDFELTLNVALLGTVPSTFQEGVLSGIPTHVRYTVELWQVTPYWRDTLLRTVVIERQLVYNPVTKEYRVTALQGETRTPHLTRDARDAQRVLSELRGLKLTPVTALDPTQVFYVRVHAETALNGENTFVTRMAGTAAQATRQSDHRTIYRIQ